MEKEKEAVKHEDEMHATTERHAKELQEIGMYCHYIYYPVNSLKCITVENSNNQKLMAEYEKYQELQARSQKLQEVIRWSIDQIIIYYHYRTTRDNWEIWRNQRKLL